MHHVPLTISNAEKPRPMHHVPGTIPEKLAPSLLTMSKAENFEPPRPEPLISRKLLRRQWQNTSHTTESSCVFYSASSLQRR